jgi:hypothetical protein
MNRSTLTLAALCYALPLCALAAVPACQASSAATLTPVIELYTSEGCSSCPPADQWLSTLKGKPVVAQAFHVAYCEFTMSIKRVDFKFFKYTKMNDKIF